MKIARLANRVGLTFTVFFAVMFVYTTFMFVKYTPVYRSMECETVENVMSPMRTDENWVNITGTNRKICWNKNAYELMAQMDRPGTVSIKDGKTLTKVGFSHFSEQTFPSLEPSVGQVNVNISLPISYAMDLLSQEKVQVVSELHALESGILTYLGKKVKSTEEVDKYCGFEMLLATQTVGPTACAYSLDTLLIPDVNSENPGPQPVVLPTEVVARRTHQKNLAFGLLFFLWGVTTFLAFSFTLKASRGQLPWDRSACAVRKNTDADDKPCVEQA